MENANFPPLVTSVIKAIVFILFHCDFLFLSGISLNVEQWDFLKGMMNDIDKDIVNVHR